MSSDADSSLVSSADLYFQTAAAISAACAALCAAGFAGSLSRTHQGLAYFLAAAVTAVDSLLLVRRPCLFGLVPGPRPLRLRLAPYTRVLPPCLLFVPVSALACRAGLMSDEAVDNVQAMSWLIAATLAWFVHALHPEGGLEGEARRIRKAQEGAAAAVRAKTGSDRGGSGGDAAYEFDAAAEGEPMFAMLHDEEAFAAVVPDIAVPQLLIRLYCVLMCLMMVRRDAATVQATAVLAVGLCLYCMSHDKSAQAAESMSRRMYAALAYVANHLAAKTRAMEAVLLFAILWLATAL